MKWNLLLPVLLLPGLIACGKEDDDDDDDDDCEDSGDCEDGTTGFGTTTGGGGGGGGGGPTATVTWGGSSVDVSISGGGGAWWFGMAETSGCSDCWTGEDCIYGYEGSTGVFAWCHDGGDTGTTLTYGGDATNLAAGTTAFDRSFEGDVTYYLESDPNYGGDGSCWVWGDDVSYYSGLGCTAL